MKLNKNWLIATALLCIGYATFQLHARGGDAFAGALGGSLMGGVIGSAMTNNNRGGGDGGGGSRGVDRVSDRVDDLRAQVSEIKHAIANDLRTLKKAQERLAKQVNKLMAQSKKQSGDTDESEEEAEVID